MSRVRRRGRAAASQRASGGHAAAGYAAVSRRASGGHAATGHAAVSRRASGGHAEARAEARRGICQLRERQRDSTSVCLPPVYIILLHRA